MKSPFQYGTMVDKECFVNRVEERKQLKELLDSGINVMLISPRRWGKSSLVKVAMDELMQENKKARVCFIDAFSIKTIFLYSYKYACTELQPHSNLLCSTYPGCPNERRTGTGSSIFAVCPCQ